jgi:hypothetical protein
MIATVLKSQGRAPSRIGDTFREQPMSLVQLREIPISLIADTRTGIY